MNGGSLYVQGIAVKSARLLNKRKEETAMDDWLKKINRNAEAVFMTFVKLRTLILALIDIYNY